MKFYRTMSITGKFIPETFGHKGKEFQRIPTLYPSRFRTLEDAQKYMKNPKRNFMKTHVQVFIVENGKMKLNPEWEKAPYEEVLLKEIK